MKTIVLSGVVGAILGVVLTAAAFAEAGGGHGTYTLWAIASLPGLAFGIGRTYAMFSMLTGPILQWTVLGLCVGMVVSGRRALWAFGILGVGVAYIVAWLAGGDLRESLDSETADKAMLAGLITGVVFIVISIIMLIAARRRARTK